jgi:hypothetical protein
MGWGSTTTATSDQLPDTPCEPYRFVPQTSAVESAVLEDHPLASRLSAWCLSLGKCLYQKATGWCNCDDCGTAWLGRYDVQEDC